MMKKTSAIRYHDISCGHRVAGHESKCAHLHGHNYRVTFGCRAEAGGRSLDFIGRVIDFSAIKAKLCMWLEENWDHKFLVWNQDPLMNELVIFSHTAQALEPCTREMLNASLVWCTFNPTAENMAEYLLNVVAPLQLLGTGIEVFRVQVEETRKCSAEAELL